jgi:hypothetical protein
MLILKIIKEALKNPELGRNALTNNYKINYCNKIDSISGTNYDAYI